ncbi:MAG: 30S ribosomal protein S20 [Syntrophomonadaceae bacterium]|nr:30S ribosomal protein S20 [Syntrophomonadaceae bacterium]
MAQSKTPAKRARRAEANRLRNKANKSRLKTAIKKYEQALQDGDVETARQRLIAATSLIDKNVSKGIMHRNTAARRKSVMARRFNALVSK